MNGIGFENMKVFKEEQWFDFKDITLLTGTNNSGKSSIINAMQMLQENIKAANIDELIKTEFKLTANQNKYGSIATFINNERTTDDNYFIIYRHIDNLKYKIKINVNKGDLESYGNIDSIEAVDKKSKTQIFILIVKKHYPNYECIFKINYKYFIDRFNKKCENTEKLYKNIILIDQFIDQVNEGTKTKYQFEEFADNLSKELSIYISGHPVTLNIEGETVSFYHYVIHNDAGYFNHFRYSKNKIKFDEIGVFYKEEKKNFSVITKEEYSSLYQPSYKNGIYDFSFLWENDLEIEAEFKHIICDYYKKGYEESQKLLCDDLICLVSNSNWIMKVRNHERIINKQNLTQQYIEGLPDFGVLAILLDKRYSMDQPNLLYNLISDWKIYARQIEDLKSEPLKILNNTNFKDTVLLKLTDLVEKNYENNDSFNYQKLIAEPVFKEINNDICQKILNLNLGLDNIYVSSNRFVTKRSYNFNDKTDFANLLQEVGKLDEGPKNNCKEFISKWIKEFGIADELLLKPDLDTGNFKASLRNGIIETQLADFGLGTNQLLPIIFSLGIHKYFLTNDELYFKMIPRTVVIEEPEANLHPALQSKLADLFVDANAKFGVQIIAETHSEYLIRRMQYLVAKNEMQNKAEDAITIANDKVNIHYINAELDEEGRKTYEINFRKNGQLTESFGKGFLDETTTLQFELYKLNNAQSN